MPEAPENDQHPIPQVVAITGIPRRTLYRWVQSGKLTPRTQDGQQVVSVAAARALAATRDASGSPGSAVPRAGTNAGTGADTGTPVARPPAGAPIQADGALAADVFGAIEAGKTPSDIVRELELPPKLVLDLCRQHEELQGAGARRGPTLPERLDDLITRVDALEIAAGSATTELADLRSLLVYVAVYLKALPVPVRGAFACECGVKGFVETLVKCSCCGRQTTWGFRPSKQ